MKIPVFRLVNENETPTRGGLAFSRGEGTVRLQKCGMVIEPVKKSETAGAPHCPTPGQARRNTPRKETPWHHQAQSQEAEAPRPLPPRVSTGSPTTSASAKSWS